MSELGHARKLQNLLSDYYNNFIDRDEYVRLRKEILDLIDHEYNGAIITETETDTAAADETSMAESMKTTSFFNNSFKDE